MSNKLITDKGKTELLRLGFKAQEAGGAFSFLALGSGNSKAAQGGTWDEVNSSEYERVEIDVDSLEDKTITLSGTFKETNYAPVDGSGTIKEIGLCNTPDIGEAGEIFFMYAEVPEVKKTGDISLQYTIVISID